MSKLLLLRGLPASGKSTYGKDRVLSGGNWVRVNKDLLRTMLHFDKWSGKNEGNTIDAEHCLALFFLNGDKNVVVDDTNMGENHLQSWKDTAKYAGAHFETKTFDTDIDTCIQRDQYREKSVGAHVIKQMAMQYRMVHPKKKYVLCDIDGTIANLDHRLHWVKNPEKKDWKSFFAEMDKDTLISNTHNILKTFVKDGYEIIFMSARPDDYREVTEKWLTHNVDVPWYTLIMRKKNDTREDSIVKKQLLDKYFDKSEIHCVIDDRPRVLKMWEEEGLEVIDVGSGIDF